MWGRVRVHAHGKPERRATPPTSWGRSFEVLSDQNALPLHTYGPRGLFAPLSTCVSFPPPVRFLARRPPWRAYPQQTDAPALCARALLCPEGVAACVPPARIRLSQARTRDSQTRRRQQQATVAAAASSAAPQQAEAQEEGPTGRRRRRRHRRRSPIPRRTSKCSRPPPAPRL